MKITVNFSDMKIVVPCGDGDLSVKELGMLATSRYKQASGKNSMAYVDVRSLRSREGGILFPEDQVSEVCDDRDEIIAIYQVDGTSQPEGSGGAPMESNGDKARGMGGGGGMDAGNGMSGAGNFMAAGNGAGMGMGAQEPSSNGANFVAKLRGLPFKATKQEITDFFDGLEIEKNGIMICQDYQGRPSGEAFVRFTNREDGQRALGKHKENLGSRYIEVYKSSMDEAARAYQRQSGGGYGGYEDGGMAGLGGPKGGQMDRGDDGYGMGGMGGMAGMGGGYGAASWDGMGPGMMTGGMRGRMGKFQLRARGLPFKATQRDICEWFSDAAFPIDVRIEYNEKGQPNGDAMVTFSTAEEARRAAFKNKQHMQHRYIEIFYVRHIVTMRGLPFRVTEREILEWFAPVAECLDVQICHGDDGRPNGDARIMFATYEEAHMALKKNKQYLQHRYVELFYEGPDYSRP